MIETVLMNLIIRKSKRKNSKLQKPSQFCSQTNVVIIIIKKKNFVLLNGKVHQIVFYTRFHIHLLRPWHIESVETSPLISAFANVKAECKNLCQTFLLTEFCLLNISAEKCLVTLYSYSQLSKQKVKYFISQLSQNSCKEF